ncbi:response regulator transcription factor [Burkholderia pyrrocinia]|uniref:response regulator transcription factor n=1 Tax=Burkholderia TaxID=32008 RepID=UPI0005011731|nr:MULTISPECIES: response regulator transcription factor [Burkholderia]EKS9889264.1 response regulator transcription factor [Burkholderia pyrrocinia]EKS9896232.1 response regulator transcription factor [Burkholderia pyrrocinia]EKS9908269.1 response regulator transcription factor [Burkholderia pyrrocinia]KFL50426.1 histidine kinase [Burkholderia pyrrocinia]
MSTLSIAVADDHPVVVALLKQLPQWAPAFRITHCCRSGAELIDALRRSPTDLVIVDYSMSRGDNPIDGFVLLRRLREVAPDAKCVMFTAQKNPSVLTGAIRLGVAAIVSKEDDIGEVVRACRLLGAGRASYFSPMIRAIVAQAGACVRDAQPKLSTKELDVVRLFVSGHSLASIAKQLGRSVSTVSTQKHMAMQKLQADSNVHLIRYAYENGLI